MKEIEPNERIKPRVKPVPAALAGVTEYIVPANLFVVQDDMGEGDFFNHVIPKAISDYDLSRLDYSILSKENGDLTLGEWEAKHFAIQNAKDPNSKETKEAKGSATDFYISLSAERGMNDPSYRESAQAAHDFLTKQGIKLAPLSEKLENKPDSDLVYVKLSLDPEQKISELGPYGTKFFDALVELSRASQQARERGAVKSA